MMKNYIDLKNIMEINVLYTTGKMSSKEKDKCAK